MATVIDEFLIKFGFDTDTKGLDKVVSGVQAAKGAFDVVRSPFDAFNEAFLTLQTVAAGASRFVDMFVGTAVRAGLAADQLAESASQLGIKAADLEFFSFAAEQTGSSAESMRFAMTMLNRELAQASNGSADATKSFSKFGIHIKDESGKLKEAGVVLQEIVEKLGTMEDPAKRSAAAVELFGKAGIGLKNFLQTSPKQLEELRQVFVALGGPTSDKLMKLGDEYDNSSKKMNVATESLRGAFAEGLLPAINKFMDNIVKFLVKNGPELRSFLFELGSALSWFGDLLSEAADTFLQASFEVAKFIKSIFDTIATASDLKAFFITLGVVIAAAFAPALVAFGLIFLAVEDFLGFLQGKDSVFGFLVENWSKWMEMLRKDYPLIFSVANAFEKIALAIGTIAKSIGVAIATPVNLISGMVTHGPSKGWNMAKDHLAESMPDIFGDLGGVLSSTLSGKGILGAVIKSMPNTHSGQVQQSNQFNVNVSVGGDMLGGFDPGQVGHDIGNKVVESLSPMLRQTKEAVKR